VIGVTTCFQTATVSFYANGRLVHSAQGVLYTLHPLVHSAQGVLYTLHPCLNLRCLHVESCLLYIYMPLLLFSDSVLSALAQEIRPARPRTGPNADLISDFPLKSRVTRAISQDWAQRRSWCFQSWGGSTPPPSSAPSRPRADNFRSGNLRSGNFRIGNFRIGNFRTGNIRRVAGNFRSLHPAGGALRCDRPAAGRIGPPRDWQDHLGTDRPASERIGPPRNG